ncbi:MAG: flavodoxin family protein [Lachnospiraceae bacterium]|nr:flavodoxin family protein [Lachnospiraceae bacterium]
MNLVIHDMSPEEWSKISPSYAGCTVISDSGNIRPCVGCFTCWTKTPGRCVIRDGYDRMGHLIHEADEVIVISRYTYGGFSGFVKNVFDRCLGYVHPYFEVTGGETHHKRRYDEDKPFTFIFRGCALSEENRANARRYVTAVCSNIRGHVKEVAFWEAEDRPAAKPAAPCRPDGKSVLLNGSMRHTSGNSAILSRELAKRLHPVPETIALQKYAGCLPKLFAQLEEASDIVLCVPLYVDGLPSQVIRFMEEAARAGLGASKRIYVLANMGLYESRQLASLFTAVREWCGEMGFVYGGGLGVSAGELIGVLMQHTPFGTGPTRRIAAGMARLADAINRSLPIEDIYTEPFLFPRFLYIFIANHSWKISHGDRNP